jgi:hypothetical protein
MKIEWLPGDGRKLVVRLPYTNAEFVIVKSNCPVCTMWGVSEDARVTGAAVVRHALALTLAARLRGGERS